MRENEPLVFDARTEIEPASKDCFMRLNVGQRTRCELLFPQKQKFFCKLTVWRIQGASNLSTYMYIN